VIILKIIKRHILASHIKNTPRLYHYYRRLTQRIDRKEPKIIELQFFDNTTREERLLRLSLIAYEKEIPLMVNPGGDLGTIREITRKNGLRIDLITPTDIVEMPYVAISQDSKVNILVIDGIDLSKLKSYPEVAAYGFKECEDEKNKKNLAAIEQRRRNRKNKTG
jgi:hypothetical protein